MTEAEWLASAYAGAMLKHLGTTASDRKLRLFACACCARIWPSITDERSRAAVLASEQYADGAMTVDQLEAASNAAREVAEELHASTFATERADAIARGLLTETDETFGIWEYASLVSAPAHAAWYAATPPGSDVLFLVEDAAENVAATVGLSAEPAFFENPDPTHRDAVVTEERARLAALLRDIFGNPFRPAAFDPAWRTPTVVALASQMYQSRDLGAMPVLADALQDAGCDNVEVLAHCRGPGPHVRGCWAVDLVLGKG